MRRSARNVALAVVNALRRGTLVQPDGALISRCVKQLNPNRG
jgi:hypothetical protein